MAADIREPERCARRNLRTALWGVLGSVHSEGEDKVRVRAKVRVRVKVRMRLKEFTLFPKPTSRSVRKFRRAHLSYTPDILPKIDRGKCYFSLMSDYITPLRVPPLFLKNFFKIFFLFVCSTDRLDVDLSIGV